MTLFLLIISIAYTILIINIFFGFHRVATFNLPSKITPKTRFSIVIPFRNEAQNLPKLLQSIDKLEYPKSLFEVILIDDASEDASSCIVHDAIKEKHNIVEFKNKRCTNSPKKDAITQAISKAKYEWIVTTDADCILPKNWLKTFDAYIQQSNAYAIAAPVIYSYQNHFFYDFQLLDIISLQITTIGTFGLGIPFLCNGANFAYKKELFDELNGFEGNTDIASGDDIFLLQKIKTKYRDHLHYLKSKYVIVKTQPQHSVSSLISQRVRWASKMTASSIYSKSIGGLVFLMNLGVILSIIHILAYGLKPSTWYVLLLILKFSLDVTILYLGSVFFSVEKTMKSYMSSFFIYPLFSVCVVLLSIFSKFSWKGREFKK